MARSPPHAHAMQLKERAREGVPEAREYVEAMLGLQVWTQGIYRQALADPHSHVGAHWCTLVWSVVGRPPMHPWCRRVIALLA